MRPLLLLPLILCLIPLHLFAEDTPTHLLRNSPRILFLGDSITADGRYVAWFETWLVAQKITPPQVVINAGLSSETVSGLSEDGHAGGKFPRPDLAERLDRILKLARPNLVIACYGMNCGIYQPFAPERFEKYKAGIQHLKSKVEHAGAKIILVTPPVYDDGVIPPGGYSYNEVLDRYADWLLAQRAQGWHVVDLHHPMTAELHARRKQDPKFQFQPDRVHPNDAGLWFIAQQLIRYFGDEPSARTSSPQEMLKQLHLPQELLPLVTQRSKILHDAYLSTAGHSRPGVAKGLPLSRKRKQKPPNCHRNPASCGRQTINCGCPGQLGWRSHKSLNVDG
ncbi:MAG: SGNH/GDSL hydrolase family protein [Planctomycetales bacterium]